jgi:hypothetical protein
LRGYLFFRLPVVLATWCSGRSGLLMAALTTTGKGAQPAGRDLRHSPSGGPWIATIMPAKPA